MLKTYKIRLYRDENNKYLHQTINLAGRAYNHAIALHKRYYKLTGKYIDRYALIKHFTKLKKRPYYAWLKAIPSQALQDVIERIDKGYKLFFRNLKHGIKTEPPSFRKVVKFKSYTLKQQAGWKWVSERKLKIGNHIYKIVNDRLPKGKIKTVTVKRNNLNHLYACFSCEIDILIPETMSGKIAGFDFGLKNFLTLHDGQETYKLASPLFFKQHLNKIRKLNKALSRKKYGSKARKRAKYALAREYKRITDKRRDYFFKIAHELTDSFDTLIFEDLNIKAMKKLWGRKVSDLAFTEFLTILQYVAKCKGCVVHFVDRFYPSSKTCHCCKHKLDKLELSVRRWRCPNCGNMNDRDENASMNIRTEGIQSLSLADVRPNLIGLSVFEAH